MSWPTASARSKNWSTEILTDADLEAQLDLLHTYFNDSLNGTTGHGHTGGTNDGKPIVLTTAVTGTLPVANGGTGLASYAVGDIPYASAATTISKLSPSTAGQAVTSAGATTAPTFAGFTTQGDVEYHNGTTRTRLAAGTSGQVLVTSGAGANPAWANALSQVLDYGTSTSASTARQATAMIMCYGTITSVANKGSQAITNLPFSSASTYVAFAIQKTSVLAGLVGGPAIIRNSGSQMTVYNASDTSYEMSWIAWGT